MLFSEAEARSLIAIPKIAEVSLWSRHPAHTATMEHAFGVLHPDGRGIEGMAVEIKVMEKAVPKIQHWVFTLSQLHFGVDSRIYQLDIRKAKRVVPGDHGWHHEHIGETRYDGPVAWSILSFDDATALFLERTNIRLEGRLNDPFLFELRG